jgi:phosphinothricin acetyltransferase
VPALSDFTKRIESIIKNYPYLVCEADGNIVGYAYVSRHRERAAYKYSADVSIYVASAYHRQGIGKALYTKLFDLLKGQHIYTLYAGIVLPNESSIGLHKSFGFNEVGTFHNVGYKQGKWHDVIWLEKPIKNYDKPE